MTTDLNDLWRFDLRRGNSPNPREGACLLDAVSWLEYGTLGDHPPCVCPVIAAFGRGINDAMSDKGRQRLKVFLPRLVGTVDPTSELVRAGYLAWQAIRVFAPMTLDAAGLTAEAAALREFRGTLTSAADAARSAAEAATATATATATAASWAASWAAGAAADTARSAAEAATAASWAASWAADAAARAAASAARAARAADAARSADAEDAMITTLDGVLKIGRQADAIEPSRFATAQQTFEMARCDPAG